MSTDELTFDTQEMIEAIKAEIAEAYYTRLAVERSRRRPHQSHVSAEIWYAVAFIVLAAVTIAMLLLL